MVVKPAPANWAVISPSRFQEDNVIDATRADHRYDPYHFAVRAEVTLPTARFRWR